MSIKFNQYCKNIIIIKNNLSIKLIKSRILVKLLLLFDCIDREVILYNFPSNY